MLAPDGRNDNPFGGDSGDGNGTGAVAVTVDAEKPVDEIVKPTLKDLVRSFFLLGWTAFGGPAAHIALFRSMFVNGAGGHPKWMTDETFLEIFALGQCLPGPTSTQVSFAIGILLAGPCGGLITGALFQYPGLLLATAAGFGANALLGPGAHWFVVGAGKGLQAGGVALVWHAAYGLGAKCCAESWTQTLGVTSAVVAYLFPEWWMFPALIIFGGVVAYFRNRMQEAESGKEPEKISSFGLSIPAAAALLLFWAALLIGLLVAVQVLEYGDFPFVFWLEAAYRTGSIIFGGGQVVLPLLLTDVIEGPGRPWMTEDVFLTGLGVVQALPGPLFNFAAYLGTVVGGPSVAGGLFGAGVWWCGLFGPGVMLIFACLPFWGLLREQQAYKAALPGLNASAVGLVFAACFQLLFKGLGNVRAAEDPNHPAFLLEPGEAGNEAFGRWLVCVGITVFHLVQNLKVGAPSAVVFGGFLGVVYKGLGVVAG